MEAGLLFAALFYLHAWLQDQTKGMKVRPVPPKPHYHAKQVAKLIAERKARKAAQEKFDYCLTGWLMLIGVGAVIVGIVLS